MLMSLAWTRAVAGVFLVIALDMMKMSFVA